MLPEDVGEQARRTIYTPLGDMFAFNRKVDYVPYLGDSSVDVAFSELRRSRR